MGIKKGKIIVTHYYDYIFIGGGIASLSCAYQIKKNSPNASILIFEKGKDIKDRKCPIIENHASKCMNCVPCSVVSGLSGAGTYNDGKEIFPNIGTKNYGGQLDDYLKDNFQKYILQFDKMISGFAIIKPSVYQPNDTFKKECLKYDLHLQEAIVKHYGSDGNKAMMTSFINKLRDIGVEFITCEDVEHENICNNIFNNDKRENLLYANNKNYCYKKLVIGVGRTGAKWFSSFCLKNNISMINSRVDIGVRVEIPAEICESLSETIYEPKIYYRTKKYNDVVRSFCWNSGDAHVCVENNDGVLSVNGYSNNNTHHKTGNSNFALLNTINFTQPFSMPNEYCLAVASLSNMISGGQVLVQRLGDLKEGKRTNEHRLSQSTTIPTLKTAIAGDISLSMPKRILDNILETIEAFNNVLPGINNYDTLLYSPEIKTYSAKPEFINDNFEIMDNVYCIGDCSGITRSIVQAGTMGMYVADKIS